MSIGGQGRIGGGKPTQNTIDLDTTPTFDYSEVLVYVTVYIIIYMRFVSYLLIGVVVEIFQVEVKYDQKLTLLLKIDLIAEGHLKA